jgi:hypothetical protein
MGLASFLNPIQSNLTKILAGALALAVVGDVGLGWFAKHEYDLKQKIVTVQKVVYQDRVQQVKVITNENNEVASKVQSDVSAGIGADLVALRLHDSPGSSALPVSAQGPGSSLANPATAVVLPTTPFQVNAPVVAGITEKDAEACVIDYDLVKGWQDWYNATQKVATDNAPLSGASDGVIDGKSTAGDNPGSPSGN